MPSQAKVTTSLPSSVSRETVIAAIHNHDLYIRTTYPHFIKYKKISGNPEVGYSCVYEVTDKRPIGRATFTLTLMSRADGICAITNGRTPTGALLIESRWTVFADKIEEDVSIDANVIMNKVIKGSIERTRPGQHSNFVQAARA